jgi:UDP-N-acetylmuramoyl-tripeptide--D-alanyl-D-alanine ligase
MATAIPENRAPFSLAEVATLTGATLSPVGVAPELLLAGVGTDTRAELAGKLFVALRGERYDAHDHVTEAVAKGAAALLVERPVVANVPVLLVPSTLAGLGALARAARRRFSGPLVGVAGAVGKTTTRALSEALLQQALPGQVHATPGNLNNLVGVPMVLLGLRSEHRVAVVEIGTNQPGEVSSLTAMAEPTIALLTLIALEHTEGLRDLDGVEQEEAAIFSGAPRVAIGNGDDLRVRRQLLRAEAQERKLFGFGADCDYRIEALSPAPGGTLLRYRTPFGQFEVSLPWLPRPVALALMAAIAAAESALSHALPPEAVAAAVTQASWRQPGRLALHPLKDGSLLLDDSYNSNPASLRAALETSVELAKDRGTRFHLVLGEMRELGALSLEEHREIGRAVKDLGAASLCAIGGDARWFCAEEASGTQVFFPDVEQAVPYVLSRVLPGDVVLVKGSRGVRTDRVAQALLHQRGALAT